MAKKQDKPAREPLLEWIAAGIGLLLTLGMLAVIGREALSGEAEQVPAVEVRVERVVAAPAGFVVEIAATNRSGATAAAVQIEGALSDGETAVETSSAMLDYVPGHATRKGGLFFSKDPRLHRLEVRALGYQAP
ncbi:MAG TPA: hypothetical protein VFZ91_13465 [Allosphingosinicella sp.]